MNLKGVKLTQKNNEKQKFGIVFFEGENFSKDKLFDTAEERDQIYDNLVQGKGILDPYSNQFVYPHAILKIDIMDQHNAQEYFDMLIERSNRLGEYEEKTDANQ